MSSDAFVIVTGGGGGIGRALVHHFCASHPVLTCGRRLAPLQETQSSAPHPARVFVTQCDIGSAAGRSKLAASLPVGATVCLLVQNAAIGDPANFHELDIAHFEEALQVNVVAPLALVQLFLPSLRRGCGRVLHLGTSVAFHPQQGTATYGVTKMAFHRLYEQLNAEGLGVPVGSLSPGMFDSEGVRDHVAKARALDLPHVKFFDEAFAKQWTTPEAELMQFVDELLAMDPTRFVQREWRFSEWRKERAKPRAYSDARGTSYGEWTGCRMRRPRWLGLLLGATAIGLTAAAAAARTASRAIASR